MIHNDKLKIDIQTADGVNKITLSGNIDEDANFAMLVPLNGTFRINFKDVKSINSCGIRTWVNFLKELKGKQVVYEQCPPVVVRQINMVPSFLGTATVESVYVPYVNDKTDEEKLVLIQSKEFTSPGFSLKPTIQEGKDELELDGNPKQIFSFVKKAA